MAQLQDLVGRAPLDVMIRDGRAVTARELLWEVDGMNRQRVEAILDAFPSVTALVHSSVEALTNIRGIGRTTAERVMAKIVAGDQLAAV